MERTERFWAKVDRTGDCWVWTAACGDHGYGVFWDGERLVGAHRYSWILAGNVIETGECLDHLCRNRACVNPAHLEAVTPTENNRRGNGWSGRKAKQTHCKRGHPLSGDNLRIYAGRRQCRECTNMRARKEWISQE